jgi:hypothetical protein
MKSFLVNTSSAMAMALLAFSFAIGGSQAVRADDSETISPAGQDAVLVPGQDVPALEQRLAYLEEVAAALMSDDDGGAENCVTKPHLDALLVSQPNVAEASPPAAIVEEANTPSAVESVVIATTLDNTETATNEVAQKDEVSQKEEVSQKDEVSLKDEASQKDDVSQKDQEPEHTGSIASTTTTAEPSALPVVEALVPGDQPGE